MGGSGNFFGHENWGVTMKVRQLAARLAIADQETLW